MNKKTFVISLGGSLIVPEGKINYKFLKDFRKLILKETKKGNKFFIVAGGGGTARKYINGAQKIVKVADDDLDWLGIHSSRLNAHLIKTIFRKEAHQEIIKNPTIHLPVPEKVIVAGGWKPGWSTDYVSTMVAQEYDVDTVINLSNIKYAYDKDPKKYKNAKKLKDVSWQEFRKVIGNTWKPGMNTPFDPIASKKGEQLGLKVIIANGKDLKNLSNIIEKKPYKGTTIEP